MDIKPISWTSKTMFALPKYLIGRPTFFFNVQKHFLSVQKNRRPRSKAVFHPELHCGVRILIRGDHNLELERYWLYFQGLKKP